MIWDDTKIVAFDCEVSGNLPEYALQPWRIPRGDAWITSASVIRFTPALGLQRHLSQLFPSTDQLRGFLQDALDNDWTVLGWNVAYDISLLIALGLSDLCMRVRWLDAMLLWRHLEVEPEYEFQTARHKKKRYRLKPEGHERWLPSRVGRHEEISFHSTDPENLRKLQAYNDDDNVDTWLIAKMIWGKLSPRQRAAALVEAEALPLVADANFGGIAIDRLTVHHLSAKLDNDAAQHLAALAPHGMTEKVVRSPKQLGDLLFNPVAEGGWGLPILKLNKSRVEGKPDNRSTDKEVLHELAFIDARAKEVKSYREALNAKGKFCTAVEDALAYSGDGRVHPTAHIFSTYTGRMVVSSKQGKGKDERPIGFALHQMKRGKEFREIVSVPEGYSLVEFDAAGQEFRWMACASGDTTMLGMCAPGEDAHAYMGAQIVSGDYRQLVHDFHNGDKNAEQNRYLGKFANLSCFPADAPVLTDRGYVRIVDVTIQDKLWDGQEWVNHDGVIYQGHRETIRYAGIEATPDHKVLVSGDWVEFQDAARHGWAIEPPLGAGRARRARAAVRIVDGVVRRAVQSLWRAVCDSALPVRDRERREPALHGDRSLARLPQLCHSADAPRQRETCRRHTGEKAPAEACERDADPVQQSQRSRIRELRRAWDRISFCVHPGGRGIHPREPSGEDVCGPGYRPEGQQRALRTGELAAADAQGERCEQATYDILNAGPRARFVVGSCVVSNCQYRTSARKLRVKARVDYDIPLELPEAQRIHATYQRTYPGVPVYWKRQIAIVQSAGYVETFGGNRVQITGNWDGDWGWSMGSTAINYRIQGTGADQKHLALMVLKPLLTEVGAHFYFELHDGLYFIVPTDKVVKTIERMKPILDNLPYQQAWGYTPPVPMPWDCKYGLEGTPSCAWGRMKEFIFA